MPTSLAYLNTALDDNNMSDCLQPPYSTRILLLGTQRDRCLANQIKLCFDLATDPSQVDMLQTAARLKAMAAHHQPQTPQTFHLGKS